MKVRSADGRTWEWYADSPAWHSSRDGITRVIDTYRLLPVDVMRGWRLNPSGGDLCVRPWPKRRWLCTRPLGHGGRHNHADGTRLLAVWT